MEFLHRRAQLFRRKPRIFKLAAHRFELRRLPLQLTLQTSPLPFAIFKPAYLSFVLAQAVAQLAQVFAQQVRLFRLARKVLFRVRHLDPQIRRRHFFRQRCDQLGPQFFLGLLRRFELRCEPFDFLFQLSLHALCFFARRIGFRFMAGHFGEQHLAGRFFLRQRLAHRVQLFLQASQRCSMGGSGFLQLALQLRQRILTRRQIHAQLRRGGICGGPRLRDSHLRRFPRLLQLTRSSFALAVRFLASTARGARRSSQFLFLRRERLHPLRRFGLRTS